jgi:hypothetical protein
MLIHPVGATSPSWRHETDGGTYSSIVQMPFQIQQSWKVSIIQKFSRMFYLENRAPVQMIG